MDTAYMVCRQSKDDNSLQKSSNLKKAWLQGGGFILICLLTFGISFCDNPGALKDKFQNAMDMTASKFMLLTAIYSWPNVILSFVGGFLVDSLFGIRWGTIIYLILTLFGQLLFAMGTFVNIFWIMVLGRFLFGIGAESVNIAQTSYTVVWLEGKALNTLFGLQASSALLGSILNTLIIEDTYQFVFRTLNYSGYECIGVVLFLASLTLIGSILCAVFLACMHSSRNKVSKTDSEKQPKSIKLTDIKDFKLTFWLIVFMCSAFDVAVAPFAALSKTYFMEKYHFEADAANKLLSLVYTISSVTAPLFGILIDKTGGNISWVVVSIIGLLQAHGLIAFTYINPYICMVIFGLSCSMFVTSLWPMIAHVMPEHQLGTAYGINQAILNLTSALTAMYCGIIVDKYGYFILELFFLAWLLRLWLANKVIHFNDIVALVPALIILMSKTKSKGDIANKSDANQDEPTNELLLQPIASLTNEILLES